MYYTLKALVVVSFQGEGKMEQKETMREKIWHHVPHFSANLT